MTKSCFSMTRRLPFDDHRLHATCALSKFVHESKCRLASMDMLGPVTAAICFLSSHFATSSMNAQTGLQILHLKSVECSSVATSQLRGLHEQHHGRSGQLGSFWVQNLHFVGLFGFLTLLLYLFCNADHQPSSCRGGLSLITHLFCSCQQAVLLQSTATCNCLQ